MAGVEKLTTVGVAVGHNPPTCRPRQATGESHIDHRSDIYAVGILGYEAACREPAVRRVRQRRAYSRPKVLDRPVPVNERRPGGASGALRPC